ncbi:MAG: hypothetical protein DCC55_02350 [Chloroflexi bacterium]|nr:MAG: hypothetical protein DCC55_02350 [Chloroflexota bacterium]
MKWLRFGAGPLALLLWLGSVGVAMVEIVVVRDLVLRLFVFIVSQGGQFPRRVENAYWSGATLSNIVVLILGVAVAIFAIATGEYHSRRVGTSQSWKLFGWTFAVQLAIFVLAYFL